MRPNKDLKFFIKYFLPGLALILTLITVGQFYTARLTEKDLKSSFGEIAFINKDKHRHEDRLTILIKDDNKEYYFFENNPTYFSNVKENIKIGDTILIKYRTKLQSIMGSGNEFKIFALSKNSKIIYSFEKVKQHYLSIGKFYLWFCAGFWIFYIFLKIRYEIK